MRALKLLSVGIVAFAITAPTAASAAFPPLLREETRPMWASATIGLLAAVRKFEIKRSAGPFGSTTVELDTPTQFSFYQTFGFHFFGGADGPAIAADLQQGIDDHVIIFGLVPKFVWDFRIIPGLYISPMVGFGYMMRIEVDCDACFNHGVTLQLGCEGKGLILGDRGMVFFRPVHIEVDSVKVEGGYGQEGQMSTAVRYGLLFGGGVIF